MQMQLTNVLLSCLTSLLSAFAKTNLARDFAKKSPLSADRLFHEIQTTSHRNEKHIWLHSLDFHSPIRRSLFGVRLSHENVAGDRADVPRRPLTIASRASSTVVIYGSLKGSSTKLLNRTRWASPWRAPGLYRLPRAPRTRKTNTPVLTPIASRRWSLRGCPPADTLERHPSALTPSPIKKRKQTLQPRRRKASAP